MKHGSLFSGIGGFDLAAEWMGWENVFHCEWNEFGQRILKYYWPKTISYDDITKTDFTIHRGKIDILTGGFPCQPYSQAGKRLGKEDDRHLWPEMLRAIREIQPGWVVGENVRGLLNWNGGLVFDEVQTDLEAEGYEVFPFLLPAAGVDAPHERYRIWFVASSKGGRSKRKFERGQGKGEFGRCDCKTTPNAKLNGLCNNAQQEGQQFGGRGSARGKSTSPINSGAIADTTSTGREQDNRKGKSGFNNEKSTGSHWQNFPTQSPICSGNDGISSLLDGITFPKWRDESIKTAGNAVVPQVVYQIFKAIEQYETRATGSERT